MNKSQQFGFTINLLSFSFPFDLIKDTDKLEISLTTFPDEKSQSHTILAKNRYYIHHYFQINISDETEEIIFSIYKKGIMKNSRKPIANSTISPNSLINSNKDNNSQNSKEILTFNLYGPAKSSKPIRPFGKRNSYSDLSNDQVLLGSMQLNSTKTEAFEFKEANSNVEYQDEIPNKFKDLIIC